MLILLQDDQKSEVVHKLTMSVQSSYDKFKDKVLDGKNIGKHNLVSFLSVCGKGTEFM